MAFQDEGVVWEHLMATVAVLAKSTPANIRPKSAFLRTTQAPRYRQAQ